jgi:hypothetical protein
MGLLVHVCAYGKYLLPANLIFSVPFGTLAIGLTVFAYAEPHHEREQSSGSAVLTWKSMRRLDFLGAVLLLGASMMLVSALLEASIQLGWSASETISLLVFAGCSWIGFFVWERLVTKRTRPEPIFPWTFFSNTAFVGMLM